MSYEIHLNIPEDSQRGLLIAALSADQHITPTEAVEKIIDLVVQEKVQPSNIVPESVRAAMIEREERKKARLATKNALEWKRPESPDLLIGYLADAPGVAETIRSLAYERRSSAFSES